MARTGRHRLVGALCALAFFALPDVTFAQTLPLSDSAASCADVLEAALPPTEAAAALERCQASAAKSPGLAMENAGLSLGATPPAESKGQSTCQSRLEAMTGSAAGAAQDRIEIRMYGTGRNQRLVLPGARSGDLCIGACGRSSIENEFALEDYTHLFQDSAASRLRPGTYSAEILPEDRQGLLVVDERDFPSGKSGALVLWRDDDPNETPIVIHAGDARPDALNRLPTLLTSPEHMDRLIGTLLSLRNPDAAMPFSVSSWQSQQDPLGTNTCRLVQYAPYKVEVRAEAPSFFATLHGQRFGAKVPAVAKPERALPPAAVSWEQIDRAQLTAGMGALGYLEIMHDLMDRLHAKAGEIRAIAYTNDPVDVRRTRLTQLNKDTAELVAETSTILEGYRESSRREGFTSDPESWASYVRELEDLTLRLEELGQNEMEAVLKPGDAGGVVAELWPAAYHAPVTTKSCQLSGVERHLAPLKVALELPQGHRDLTAQGQGRFWFVLVPGTQDTYRLRSSIRYDMAQLAPEHRAMADWYIHTALNSSCSNRFFLEKTDHAASQSGAVELLTGVRYEYWQCAWFKYPCGVSLKGTKSCRKNIRTRIFQAGQSARHRLTPSVSGTELGFELSGQGITPAAGRFDLETIPEFRALMITTGLMPESARFIEWDHRLWHGTELKGDVDLSAATACRIQTALETN